MARLQTLKLPKGVEIDEVSNDNLFTHPSARSVPTTLAVKDYLHDEINKHDQAFWPDGLHRNAIINGNFDIWQRGTSFDSSGYTADRWVVSNSGGSASTVTRVNTPSDAPFDAAYHLRRAVITAPTANHQFILHRIEDVRSFAGHTVCFTFWAKVDTGSKIIYCSAVQVFGSGGSSEVWIPAQWITVTSEWQKFNIVFNIPSIVGKTIGAGSYLEIHFGEDKDFKLYAIEIAQVQLNIGDKPLPFAPRSYAEELALCQRYYEKSCQKDVIPSNGMARHVEYPGVAFSLNCRAHIDFVVPKRVIPTMTWYRTTDGKTNGQAAYYDGSWVDGTTTHAQDVTETHVTLAFSLDSAPTPPIGLTYLVSVGWAADAEL